MLGERTNKGAGRRARPRPEGLRDQPAGADASLSLERWTSATALNAGPWRAVVWASLEEEVRHDHDPSHNESG